MRHTDPRPTASVYTDEKLLPLAAELQNAPAIPLIREDNARWVSLSATGTDS